ncbi:uncharacterized protein LOC124414932 [Diprion similis]|uniref:uncharacterized protein LOC124414932 n=1 Tax=Diprion similis TaxID=362088 RepID=UPI001EF91E19|nr:uncharacterized protein LOC124414932 [Diprion similis]
MSSALYSNSRYSIYTNNCRLNVVTAFIKKNNNNTDLANSRNKFAVNPSLSCRTLSTHRYFSTQQNENFKRPYIPLMDYPRTFDVGFCEAVRYNRTLKYHMAKIDREFDYKEFKKGSIKAVLTVSNALSLEDYESLEGLVTPDAIKILKGNVSRMSKEQKAEIAMDGKKFLLCQSNSSNIRDDKSSKIVEILMFYHFFRNWESIPKPEIAESISSIQLGDFRLAAMRDPNYPQNTICCNYRFVRHYGHMNSSWLIDVVNHFRLCDVKE